jgi:rhodanese-related sulfurtransferase
VERRAQRLRALNRRASAVRKVLLEALLVAAIGVALSFLANGVSPRGLKLSRDFFHGANVPIAATNGVAIPGTNAATSAAALKARLESKGLQLVDSNRVVQLFRDPRMEQGLVAFIDARDDAHYEAGHVPSAYQLDYYRVENYLPTILPVCQIAEEIVVYCNGGTCEDSEFSADFLLSAGIAKEKLLVYGGGFTEWETNGLPVEIGVRQSGQIRNVPREAGQVK